MSNRILSIQIDGEALEIEEKYRSLLPPYQNGIYLTGGEKPIILKDKYYYTIKRLAPGKIKEYQIKDFNISSFNSPIYDSNGIMIVNEAVIANKAHRLCYKPTVPVYGRMICNEMIESVISRIVEYSKVRQYQPLHVLAKKLFQSNFFNFDDFRESVEDSCENILVDLREFIFKDPKQIYSVTRLGGVINISELGDYRILEHSINEWVSQDDRTSIG